MVVILNFLMRTLGGVVVLWAVSNAMAGLGLHPDVAAPRWVAMLGILLLLMLLGALLGPAMLSSGRRTTLRWGQAWLALGALAAVSLANVCLKMTDLHDESIRSAGRAFVLAAGVSYLVLGALRLLWSAPVGRTGTAGVAGAANQDQVPAPNVSPAVESSVVPGNDPDAGPGRSRAPASKASGQPAEVSLIQRRVSDKNLSSIAGMAQLKVELQGFLDGFRHYRGGQTKGVADRNGLLLSGPPGNGKTLVAEALAGELQLPLLKVTVDDVASRWLGQAQERLGQIIRQAVSEAPCVVFFDEFDALAPSRDGQLHEEHAKTVNALLSGIDEMRSHQVVLIAATNFVDKLDAAVVRDGRFDFRIEIPYPDLVARKSMVSGLAVKHGVHLSTDVVDALAAHWVQRSAAFMDGAFKRARDDAARAGTAAGASPLRFSLDALKRAGRKSSRRESAIPKDCAAVSDLYLTRETRAEVDTLLFRMKCWEEVVARGGSAPKGILLWGPPGTGKTSLVRAIAKTLGEWHVFEVRTAEVLADPRKFREVTALATQHRPAIVFLDEADELLRDRQDSICASATNEVLKAMDGMMASVPEVVFAAATNRLNAMDAAALRGGRFSDRLYLGLFKGVDLERYVRTVLASKPAVRLAPDLTAALIAATMCEAGAADVNEVISRAVNYQLGSGQRRALVMADIERAWQAVQNPSALTRQDA